MGPSSSQRGQTRDEETKSRFRVQEKRLRERERERSFSRRLTGIFTYLGKVQLYLEWTGGSIRKNFLFLQHMRA